MSPSEERTFTFVSLYYIIMAATISLGRPWAGSIYSILPQFMESEALEKSTNNIVESRFFYTHTVKNWTDSQNLWRRGSISPNAILVHPKYLLNFGFYAVA